MVPSERYSGILAVLARRASRPGRRPRRRARRPRSSSGWSTRTSSDPRAVHAAYCMRLCASQAIGGTVPYAGHPCSRPTSPLAAQIRASRTGPTGERAGSRRLLGRVRRRRPPRRPLRPPAPPRSWAALRAARRLPVLDASPSDSPGGRAVRRVLASRATYGVPGRLLGTAVLEVPADPDDYLVGRRAQTLRRKIRSAERRGLVVRRIEDPAERRELVALANSAEQTHVDPSYRVPTPDNDDLLEHDVWLTVDDAEGSAAAAGGGAARRRVRDAALLPHPRRRRRAQRRPLPRQQRAGRRAGRAAACATCSTPPRRPSRPTGCGTSSGWWGSATRGCGCAQRSYW